MSVSHRPGNGCLGKPTATRRAWRDRFFVAASVASLLAGGARAQSGPNAPSAASKPPVDGSQPGATLGEVIVTARKRSESLVKVPSSVTAFGTATLSKFNIQDFSDYATKVPNLSFNNGGAAASTGGATQTTSIQIRGVSGVGTTGYYIDDTPVPDTIDPRVVDLQRVEVLKGPQGTLFGASSMGGNVRLITNQPGFAGDDVSYMLQGGGTSHGGSPDYGGDVVANFVAIPDKLAFRVTGFGQHDAGFLTNTYPAPAGTGRLSSADQDQVTTYGGSVASLLEVTSQLEVTFKLMGQEKDYHGLPEAYAPLPAFTPVYTLDRTANAQEYAYDRFLLAAIDVKYQGSGYTLTSSTSYFYNNSFELENGTEGAEDFFAQNFGVTLNQATPLTGSQNEFERSITEEARASFDPWHGLSGVAGVYYSHDTNDYKFPTQTLSGLAASGLWPNNELITGEITVPRDTVALFGEAYYKFLDKFTLTLGGRLFYLNQSYRELGEGFFFSGPYNSGVLESSQTGFSPKAALSYAVTPDANIYALYSKGFRPGGPTAPLQAVCQAGAATLGINTSAYQADTVDNYEVGAKSSILGGRAYVSAAAFQINWNNIQQTVFLPCDATITANTGSARIRGGEFEFNGELFRGFDVRAGVGVESAIITNPGHSQLTAGERVFQVPNVNATFGFNYAPALDWPYPPFISADYSYVGDRTSGTFDQATPLLEPAYSLVNARIGVSFGKSTLSLYGDNLANTKANLGDIQQITFNETAVNALGQTVPARLRVGVLRPLSVGLQFKSSF